MKIAITGASGMLGTALLSELSSNQKIFATARSEGINNNNIIWRCFDLLDTARLKQWLFDVSPDVVIHCAAMVDVEKCESQVDIAYELHAHTTKIISSFLKSNFGYLIYISTDSVFDGLKETAYLESDSVNPLNVYAKSKLLGESAVLLSGVGIVLRTNIVGWSITDKLSFSEWLFKCLIEGKELNLFYDVYFSPLNVSDLSKVMLTIINKKPHGLYNVSSDFGISKYDFGLLMAKIFNIDPYNINKISVNDIGLSAPRPHNMVLSNRKISKELDIKLGTPKDSILTLKYQYDTGWLSSLNILTNTT